MNSTARTIVASALAAALCATAAADAKPPKRPDLVVGSAALVSGTPKPGAVIAIREATANIGTGRAKKKSTTALLLSRNSKLEPTDARLGDREHGKLRAGRSGKRLIAIALPKNAAGSYRLFACADANHTVAETKEKNNCTSIPLAISGPKPTPKPPPKLAYLKISPPKATVNVGQPAMTANAVFGKALAPDTVTFQVEGFASNGADLGDFTAKATFGPALLGTCVGATCSVGATGTQPIDAAVGNVHATAEITGITREMSCRGNNYDVNGSTYDGCEAAQPNPGHTNEPTARSLGAKTCDDKLSKTTFSGQILSDARRHESPTVVGFREEFGSAPEWAKIQALGPIGGGCVNDYSLTITTSGGGDAYCNHVVLRFSDGGYHEGILDGHGTRTISAGAGSYKSGSLATVQVFRTCAASVREKVSYTVSFHL